MEEEAREQHEIASTPYPKREASRKRRAARRTELEQMTILFWCRARMRWRETVVERPAPESDLAKLFREIEERRPKDILSDV